MIINKIVVCVARVMESEVKSFTKLALTGGYHVCKEILSSAMGEELLYFVAVIRATTTISFCHMQRSGTPDIYLHFVMFF